jgi:hypothetical protein
MSFLSLVSLSDTAVDRLAVVPMDRIQVSANLYIQVGKQAHALQCAWQAESERIMAATRSSILEGNAFDSGRAGDLPTRDRLMVERRAASLGPS